jgi:hypothetical protein
MSHNVHSRPPFQRIALAMNRTRIEITESGVTSDFGVLSVVHAGDQTGCAGLGLRHDALKPAAPSMAPHTAARPRFALPMFWPQPQAATTGSVAGVVLHGPGAAAAPRKGRWCRYGRAAPLSVAAGGLGATLTRGPWLPERRWPAGWRAGGGVIRPPGWAHCTCVSQSEGQKSTGKALVGQSSVKRGQGQSRRVVGWGAAAAAGVV